jgi:hypothetical protein
MTIETNRQLIQKLSHAIAQYEDQVGADWAREVIIYTLGSLYTCCAAIAYDTNSLLNFLRGSNAPTQIRRDHLHRLRQVVRAMAELGKRMEIGPSSHDEVAELESRAFDLAETLASLCDDVGIVSKFGELADRSSQLLEQAIAVWSTTATGSK